MRTWQRLIVAASTSLSCTLDFSEVGPRGGSTSSAGGNEGAGESGGESSAGGGNGGGAGSSSSSGVSGCAARGGQCIAAGPADWSAPVVRVASGTDGCPASSSPTKSGGTAIASPQTPCPCALQPPSCTTVAAVFHALVGCRGEPLAQTLQDGSCVLVTPPFSTSSVTMGPAPMALGGNTCEAVALAVLYEEPSALCAFDGADDCEAPEACAPAGQVACVYKLGVQSCPDGWGATDAFVVGANVCACGDPADPICGGKLEVFASDDCSGAATLELQNATCTSSDLPTSFAIQYFPEQPATCGSVVPNTQITEYTVCCRPVI